jgi:hypothetical protein
MLPEAEIDDFTQHNILHRWNQNTFNSENRSLYHRNQTSQQLIQREVIDNECVVIGRLKLQIRKDVLHFFLKECVLWRFEYFHDWSCPWINTTIFGSSVRPHQTFHSCRAAPSWTIERLLAFKDVIQFDWRHQVVVPTRANNIWDKQSWSSTSIAKYHTETNTDETALRPKVVEHRWLIASLAKEIGETQFEPFVTRLAPRTSPSWNHREEAKIHNRKEVKRPCLREND